MNDGQLLEHSPEEARQKLNDDQLERYNELKQQELQGDIEERQEENEEIAQEGLAALREAKEQDLTVTVHGIEFLADVNDEQVEKLAEFSKYEDKTEEDLDDSTIQEIREEMLDVLADLCLDYDRQDFAEEFGGKGEKEPAGIITVGSLVYDVLDEIEDLREQKKRR